MLSREEVAELRDRLEEQLAPAIEAALRAFLRQVSSVAVSAARRAPLTLTAAAPAPEPASWFTLGELSGWWAAQVDFEVMDAVQAAWDASYSEHRADGSRVTKRSLDSAEYLAAVRDRLVRGIEPAIAEDAFDRVRVTVSQSAAAGWSRPELATRIAQELSWTTDRDYWEGEKRRASSSIDEILDPLGPPGTPAREHARLHDPTVRVLQAERSRAVLALEAEQSSWKTRATRIARTESTGANNYAALTALSEEGAEAKEWMAARDKRTRDEHRAADGQVVALTDPFIIGGSRMQMPGDPSAPAYLTVNCRCSIVGAELPEQPQEPLPSSEPAPEPEPEAEPVRFLTDDEVESELGELMNAGDYSSDRFIELSEELDKRSAGIAEREAQAEAAMMQDRWNRRAVEEMDDEERADFREWRYGRGGPPKMTQTRQREQDFEDYQTWIEVQYRAAESELNGVLLSAAGQRLVDEGKMSIRDLFTLKRRDYNRLASEEMQEWLSRNPPRSFADYLDGSRLQGRRLGTEWD